MSSVTNNRLILKNTLMLYMRQILVLFVGLYSSRIVLKTLGAIDFGIFNVVAGVVTMLGFLSNAMTAACQRYFSFDIGKGDIKHLKNVYDTSFIIYLIIAFFIVIICETIGLWFVNSKLVIPVERLPSARIVLHLSLGTFLFTIMSTPFTAIITAHEDMSIYAWMSIFECSVKLILVILLGLNHKFDSMVLYGGIFLFIAFCNFCIYAVICIKKYDVCRFRLFCDFLLVKEMFQYVLWNMLSGISGAFYNQGLNMVLNIYCGPIVNSARAIASQVNGAVTTFASKFSSAVQPQLIKNYAIKAFDDLYVQLWRGIKLTYALMFVFLLPLSFEILFVLKAWLGNYPEYTAIFTVLTLIATCIEVTTYSLDVMAQATGKIRLYQIVVSLLTFCNVPLSVLALNSHLPPYSIICVYILLLFVSIVLRMLILRKLVEHFSILSCIKKVFFPLFLFTLLSLPIPYLFYKLISVQPVQFAIVVASSVVWVCFLAVFVLFEKTERQKLFYFVTEKITDKIRSVKK
ncbi:MAG: hypothetical protein IJ158_01365 [Treponema sp.]|nr:hypothetical protein [Treponema sp.]